MESTAPGPKTIVAKTRLEALSDGVFAVVLTLLVIDLKLEALPPHSSEEDIWHALRQALPHFGAYGITFAITCGFWIQHHALFHALRTANRGFYWLNALFLFSVSLLPFSVSTFMKATAYLPCFLVYYANLSLMGLALALGWHFCGANGLLHAEANPWTIKRYTLTSWAFFACGVVGVALGAIRAELSGIGYLLPLLALRLYLRRLEPKTT